MVATVLPPWFKDAMAGPKRITKRIVDLLKEGEVTWDVDVRGFGVRRQRTRKVYLLKARINGRQRWITIGDHGSPWTPEKARKEAQRLWGEIRAGVDLARLRARQRDSFHVADLCEKYLKEYARPHKKPSSVRMDERNIANHVLPLMGDLLVEEITRKDVDHFKLAVKDGRHADPEAESRSGYGGGAVVTGGSGVANRCLALLSKMFNLAELWGLRPDNSNPVRHVEKYPESRKERFLSAKEFDRLANVLEQLETSNRESPFVIAAIRLLVFTGARLSEILTLRWEFVNLEHKALWLPDSKTGRKTIYLSSPALAVLESLPRISGNPYVIAGKRDGGYLVNLQKPWGRIRKLARLETTRIHDLRHSFASIAAGSGMSLPVIGKLLGHTKSVTTERYSHLAADPLKAANEEVGQRLAELLGSRGSTNARS
jgi:integrase